MKALLLNFAGLLFFLLPIQLQAQRFRMGTPWIGKTYSETNYGRNNQEFLLEADIQYQQFDFEGTFFALENAVAQTPQSADALLRRAAFKKRFGMETEAAQDFSLANRLNPYAADLYGYHGPYSILNVIEYQPNQAVLGLSLTRKMGYYYEFLDRQYLRRDIEAMELAYLEDVIMQMEENNLPEALLLLDALLNLYPQSAIAYDLKGVVFTKQEQYEEAKVALNKAVALQPEFAIAWYNLSRLEKESGRMDTAREYLDRAIQLEEDLTKAYFDRALLRKAMGDKEGALEDYNTIIDKKGENYLEAYLNRGLTRKMLGDFNGALSDLNTAVKAFSDNPELYKNRGNLYLLFGYPNRAIADYTQAINLDENFAEAYYNRGLAHLLMYDRMSACYDLIKSADLGLERALEKQQYFCVE